MDSSNLHFGSIYRHKVNGKEYTLVNPCKFKFCGVWFDAVQYIPMYPCDPGFNICVRTVWDFLENFEVVNGS